LINYLENLENRIKFDKFLKDVLVLKNLSENKNCEIQILYQIYDFKILSRIRDFIIIEKSRSLKIKEKEIHIISFNSIPLDLEKQIKEEIFNFKNTQNNNEDNLSCSYSYENLISIKEYIKETNSMSHTHKISGDQIFDSTSTPTTTALKNKEDKKVINRSEQNDRSVIHSSGYFIESIDEGNSLLGFWIESEFTPDENLQDHVLKDYLNHLKKIKDNILFDFNK
jgi:hypothetical protein